MPVGRYVVPVMSLFIAAHPLLSQASDGQALRKAPPLDSAKRAEKASYEKTLASLRSSPSRFDSTRNYMALLTHMMLGRLGYLSGPFDATVSPNLVSAIRAYERDRGLRITGDPLTFELAASLRADDEAFEVDPVLPTRIVSGGADFTLIQGAWSFADMGNQSIAVEIACDRQARQCIESQAIYRASFMGGPMLSTDQQRWEIARWDNVEIATQPADFTCARYVLRINLVQKAATKIRSTISNSASCSHQQKADLIINLDDGGEIAAAKAKLRSRDPFPALLSPAAARLLNPK